MAVIVLQMRKKGNLTLPAELRSKYGLNEGDVFTLIDLGDGSFMLSPRISRVNQLGDRVAQVLQDEKVTLEDLLSTLDEERERYFQEHYVQD
jgi:bifunctional DNA-binding transcriptional regulator/antitoxin component of YhaV-PrlF toxin-antitoxin module